MCSIPDSTPSLWFKVQNGSREAWAEKAKLKGMSRNELGYGQSHMQPTRNKQVRMPTASEERVLPENHDPGLKSSMTIG